MKNEVEFPRVTKKKFPGVLVFGLEISKVSNTILWNFQGWNFVLSRISRGKVKKMKNFRRGGGGSKKYIFTASPVCFFIWNNPISDEKLELAKHFPYPGMRLT